MANAVILPSVLQRGLEILDGVIIVKALVLMHEASESQLFSMPLQDSELSLSNSLLANTRQAKVSRIGAMHRSC